MDSTAKPEIVCNFHCLLGENPLWDEREGVLYWTDIDSGRLHVWHETEQRGREIYAGPAVGGFTQEEDGSLLLFRERDVVQRHPDGRLTVRHVFTEPGQLRFNDVTADPRGRVFAGTKGLSDTSGGVWRFDPDGSVRRVISGTGIANGMAFSPDGRTFYWTCSTRERVYAYDYDEATGEIGRERVWHQAGAGRAADAAGGGDAGTPDGMVIDADGTIWSARWDGFAVQELVPASGAADGVAALGRRVRFPVAQVSSVTFGGADWATMFVTTAGGDGVSSLEGALFRVQVPGVRGRRKFRSRLCG